MIFWLVRCKYLNYKRRLIDFKRKFMHINKFIYFLFYVVVNYLFSEFDLSIRYQSNKSTYDLFYVILLKKGGKRVSEERLLKTYVFHVKTEKST